MYILDETAAYRIFIADGAGTGNMVALSTLFALLNHSVLDITCRQRRRPTIFIRL